VRITSARKITSHTRTLRAAAWLACIAASVGLAYSPALIAKEPLPQETADGLQLQKDTKARAVYLKPGATFNQYRRIAILDCFVDFAKDWQRDTNDNASLDRRVSADDMARIKTELAAEFKKVFTKELQDKGGYTIVNAAGPDVLVLRPALINLMINAPDVDSPGFSRTIVASAGQMTLYLELWDSATNTLLARVIDPQADPGFGGQIADRMSNTVAANRLLQDWAMRLRKHLDAVKDKPAGN
jgi:hypothetical protein